MVGRESRNEWWYNVRFVNDILRKMVGILGFIGVKEFQSVH